MNLSELKSEQMSYIAAIDLPQREKQRLTSMGIIPGSAVSVLMNNKSSLVIEYMDTFLAISHDIAKHISMSDDLAKQGIQL